MYFYLEFEDVGFLFLIFLLDFLLDLLVGFAYWICLLDLLVGMLDGFLLDGLTCSMLQHLKLSRHFDFHSISMATIIDNTTASMATIIDNTTVSRATIIDNTTASIRQV